MKKASTDCKTSFLIFDTITATPLHNQCNSNLTHTSMCLHSTYIIPNLCEHVFLHRRLNGKVDVYKQTKKIKIKYIKFHFSSSTSFSDPECPSSEMEFSLSPANGMSLPSESTPIGLIMSSLQMKQHWFTSLILCVNDTAPWCFTDLESLLKSLMSCLASSSFSSSDIPSMGSGCWVSTLPVTGLMRSLTCRYSSVSESESLEYWALQLEL